MRLFLLILFCFIVIRSLIDIYVLFLDWTKLSIMGWIDILTSLILVLVAIVRYKSRKKENGINSIFDWFLKS
jgi:hypothetical protein